MGKSVRIQVCMTPKLYAVVQDYMTKGAGFSEIRNDSQAICGIIEEFQNFDKTLSRYTSMLEKKESEIAELKYSLKHIYRKQIKEMKQE